jgi:ankyrin repeat protein
MMRQVGSIEKMKEPYILAKRYNWKGFLEFFLEHKELLDKQIDLHQSTPFHYAAHCGSSEMYNEMLARIDPKEMQHVLRMQDDMGNTPLHEVAFTGEVEMTKSILKKEEETMSEQFPKPLLELRNILGETPVYRAAALGKTNLINYFVEELGVDLRDHFHRTEDNKSILHTAVIDQFFGFFLTLFVFFKSCNLSAFTIYNEH